MFQPNWNASDSAERFIFRRHGQKENETKTFLTRCKSSQRNAHNWVTERPRIEKKMAAPHTHTQRVGRDPNGAFLLRIALILFIFFFFCRRSIVCCRLLLHWWVTTPDRVGQRFVDERSFVAERAISRSSRGGVIKVGNQENRNQPFHLRGNLGGNLEENLGGSLWGYLGGRGNLGVIWRVWVIMGVIWRLICRVIWRVIYGLSLG